MPSLISSKPTKDHKKLSSLIVKVEGTRTDRTIGTVSIVFVCYFAQGENGTTILNKISKRHIAKKEKLNGLDFRYTPN